MVFIPFMPKMWDRKVSGRMVLVAKQESWKLFEKMCCTLANHYDDHNCAISSVRSMLAEFIWFIGLLSLF